MRNPSCQLCLRCKHTENICIWGTAADNSTKEVMIVIDTISPSTNMTSLFTTGQGGKILLDLLKDIDIVDKCYVTAAVKCHTDTKPTAKEIKICRRYLMEEIETVNPKLIICLGSSAVAGVFSKTFPLKNMRQRYFDYPELPHIKVAATFSHNIYFVEPQKYSSLVQDLHWIMNNFNRQDDKFDYELSLDKDIGNSFVYGLDVETTGLNVYTDKLLTVALANPINKLSVGYNIGHKNNG